MPALVATDADLALVRRQLDELTERVERLEQPEPCEIVADSGSRDDVQRAADREPDILRVPPFRGPLNGTIELLDTTSLVSDSGVMWFKQGRLTNWDHPSLRVIATGKRKPWRWSRFNLTGTGFADRHPDIGALLLGGVTVDLYEVHTAGFGRSGITLRGEGRAGAGQPGQPRGLIRRCSSIHMGYQEDGQRRLGYGIDCIGYDDGKDEPLVVEDCVGTDCRHFYTQVNHAVGLVRHTRIIDQPEDSHAFDAHGATTSWASSRRLTVHDTHIRSGRSDAGLVFRGGEGIAFRNKVDIDVNDAVRATSETSNQPPGAPQPPGALVWGWENYHKGILVPVATSEGGTAIQHPPPGYEEPVYPDPRRAAA